MSKNMKLVHIAAIVAVGAFISATPFVVEAPPPSGVSFSPVGRATLPEFSVKRKDKAIDWRVTLDADQPIDVATQVVTFQPGGFSGWHTHPGQVFFTVRTGTLTVYEGDDPSCTPLVFPAGTGAVEAGASTHHHNGREGTNSITGAGCTDAGP